MIVSLADPEVRERWLRRQASIEAQALADMVSRGVTLSTEGVEPQPHGCDSCTWHAVNLLEQHEDGGTASAIRSWLDEGYLGDPRNVVLHPVLHTI